MPGGFVPAREEGMVSAWVGPKPSLRGSTKKRTYPKRNLVLIKRTVKQCMEKLLELKHIETAIALNPALAAGQFVMPLIMAQGTTPSTRIANQIKIRSVCLEGTVGLAPATTADVVRALIFIDRQPNGAAPAVVDILTAATATSCYNMDKVDHLGHRFRFRVLLDKMFEIEVYAGAVVTRAIPFSHTVKLNHIVHYQGNAGTIADLMTNNLSVLIITAAGSATWNGHVSVCYTDE